MSPEGKLAVAITRRRSIRRYDSIPVRRAVIERLLLPATRAPSAHNRQPWRFAVIEERAPKEKLALAMGQRLRQDRTADGDDPQAIEQGRIIQAPAVGSIPRRAAPAGKIPDGGAETATAAQNLLLAADRKGLAPA